MQALQFHGSSLALCSLVFSLLMPLRVSAASQPACAVTLYTGYTCSASPEVAAPSLSALLCHCEAVAPTSHSNAFSATHFVICGHACCAVDRQHPASQLDPPSCEGQGPSLQLHSLCTDGAARLQHGGVGDKGGAAGTAPQAEDGCLLGGGPRGAGPSSGEGPLQGLGIQRCESMWLKHLSWRIVTWQSVAACRAMHPLCMVPACWQPYCAGPGTGVQLAVCLMLCPGCAGACKVVHGAVVIRVEAVQPRWLCMQQGPTIDQRCTSTATTHRPPPWMQICITTMAIVAAYLMAQYAIAHTFTIATVGCVAVGAFITACVWLTVHDQVSPGCRGPARPDMGRCAVHPTSGACNFVCVVRAHTALANLLSGPASWSCKLMQA